MPSSLHPPVYCAKGSGGSGVVMLSFEKSIEVRYAISAMGERCAELFCHCTLEKLSDVMVVAPLLS